MKHQIVALRLLGYLFYAYGIYVIERAYNGLSSCTWQSSPWPCGRWYALELTFAAVFSSLPYRDRFGSYLPRTPSCRLSFSIPSG
ncbi:hypothetical protein [Arthrobacter flavus]|uniref:Uncharacterized protein n=1 Tax=Arthrobacter flavus TaxID=95172 RepID=A0ABW4QBY8_9MICC